MPDTTISPHTLFLFKQQTFNLPAILPFAGLHVDINDRGRRGEGGVAQAQNRAVMVPLPPRPQTVCCLRKPNLLEFSQALWHAQIWRQFRNGCFLHIHITPSTHLCYSLCNLCFMTPGCQPCYTVRSCHNPTRCYQINRDTATKQACTTCNLAVPDRCMLMQAT